MNSHDDARGEISHATRVLLQTKSPHCLNERPSYKIDRVRKFESNVRTIVCGTPPHGYNLQPRIKPPRRVQGAEQISHKRLRDHFYPNTKRPRNRLFVHRAYTKPVNDISEKCFGFIFTSLFYSSRSNVLRFTQRHTISTYLVELKIFFTNFLQLFRFIVGYFKRWVTPSQDFVCWLHS